VVCCCGFCWAAGEGEAVLERFWGVREVAGVLERLLLLLVVLCQGLCVVVSWGVFWAGLGWGRGYFCCWVAMVVGVGWVKWYCCCERMSWRCLLSVDRK
jgi:hypothetical protein